MPRLNDGRGGLRRLLLTRSRGATAPFRVIFLYFSLLNQGTCFYLILRCQN
ncbi:hypothetical protein HanRHA438_Chr04g0191981 [Helianthus annuus]|nr:hypothetical protein HanRHA438_Chr04g0191981 [Helianthus annuus]